METKNSVFFNVDTQKDFFNHNSVDIPNGESILRNLNSLTDLCNKRRIKVVNTVRWFLEDNSFFSEVPDYVSTFPKHCVKDTDGALFIPETTPIKPLVVDWGGGQINFPEIHKNKDLVITKKNIDVFDGNQYFQSIVHNLGIPFMARPNFVVYGVDTSTTVVGLLRRGYSVTVVSDANLNVRGIPLSKQDINPNENQELLELNFKTTGEILNLWNEN